LGSPGSGSLRSRALCSGLLLLLACSDADTTTEENPTGPNADAPADATRHLDEGEVLAAVITDERALIGGIASEGRTGDVKIYNDRVRFVIQAARSGGYYIDQGGVVIDADVVRGEGAPGRDMLTEWMPVVGLGRLSAGTTVTVADDGTESGRAVVVVEGEESPIHFLEGALESEDVIADEGLYFHTEYALDAGSSFLGVTTTVTAQRGSAAVQIGDAMLASQSVNTMWAEGIGLTDEAAEEMSWIGFVGDQGDLALGVFAETAPLQSNLGMATISSLLSIAAGFDAPVELEDGESRTWTRLYGVGPDLSTLTDAWLERTGTASEAISGTVSAPDGEVAGARVNILVDGLPWSMAITDEDGAFTAQVPAGAETTTLADGRGTGIYTDLPTGAAPYGPYSGSISRTLALSTMTDGGPEIVQARGRGSATTDDPLTLAEPGWLTITAADGLPFEARLSFSDGDPESVDGALVQPRPSGYAALAWGRDGAVRLPLTEGTYSLVAHRGLRYELDTADVEIVAGEEAAVTVVLEAAYTPDGWLVADPHMHAAPSPDGKIPMAERLVVAAGVGIQLPFGTDHDHVVDYSPLVDALGLDDVLASIVATEVSPVVRGHFNTYPLQSDLDQINGSGWRWWLESFTDTGALMDMLRGHHKSDAGPIVQVNHPMSGLASFAGWEPGRVSRPDYWTDDFDAMEVNNGGGFGDEFELYNDLISRGLEFAPTGVSDSHNHLSGGPGYNVTFLGVDERDPGLVTDDALVEAFVARRTVVASGAWIALSIDPGSDIVGPTTLDARAHTPSWIGIDRLILYENGEAIDTVEGTSASWELAPDADAAYVVLAQGDSSMSPISSRTPWAMTSAIRLDVDGDGWAAPLPPLSEG